MITTYKVEVERDRRWWMISVPEIDQITQARRLSEVQEMARSLIAISTDTRLEDVGIEITTIRLSSGHFQELLGLTRDLRNRRTHLREFEDELLRDSREFAYYLNADGVPVRDIAELLGVSAQRVSQLLNEQPSRPEDATDDVSDLVDKLEASVKARRGVTASHREGTVKKAAAKKSAAKKAPAPRGYRKGQAEHSDAGEEASQE